MKVVFLFYAHYLRGYVGTWNSGEKDKEKKKEM